MIYRRFGRTGLRMPVLTCGGMRFMHAWKDAPLHEIPGESHANVLATVRRAVELGITHLETARGYGSSERQLGSVIPSLPRDRIIVQTKIGPDRCAWRFLRTFRDSLRRLGLDRVDLLAIHGLNDEERLRWTVGRRGCLRAARRLQDRGLVGHVGFSTHAPLDVILAAIRHEGSGGFDYVNLHWYAIFQRNLPAIEEAAARDMGVFIISPSDKGGMLYRPPARLLELCAPHHPIVFNDLFCLRRPEVHTISIGAARPGDFDLHLEAVRLLDRAEEIVAPIAARLDRAMAETVGGDFARRFQEGLPSWRETPGGINIPVILWLRNLAAAYGMTEYARMRYGLLGSGGTWFPGESAARVDEVDLGEALRRSPFAERIPGLLREAHAILGAPPERA